MLFRSSNDIVDLINKHLDSKTAEIILSQALPSLWALALLLFSDTTTILTSWFMPFLGLFAAFLANSVPIGGGIVYIPALYLLGVNVKLGAAFTVATMTFGNGKI